MKPSSEFCNLLQVRASGDFKCFEHCRAGDFAKAKSLYDHAAEICKASTVESNKKTKEPPAESAKEVASKKTVDGPLSGTKLLLSNPKDNIQVFSCADTQLAWKA